MEVSLHPSITGTSSKHPSIKLLKGGGYCVICHARLDRPVLPPPRVDLQRCRQRVGMVSLSHVCPPTPQWGWSSTPCVRHAWSLVTARKNGHVTIAGVHFDYPLHRRTAGCYSSIALTLYAYAVVHASVIKEEPRHLTEQQMNIKGSENKSKFKCFIQSSNFRTSFNVPNSE